MRQSDRFQISSPVLLSSTNVQTRNAPDIATAHKLRKVSSVSSHSSGISDKDSDASSSPRSRGASITDNSSVGSSPSSPNLGHSPNSYFGDKAHSSPRKAKSSVDLKDRARSTDPLPPIPSRAPTHSKVAHEQLARKRSLQTLNAGTNKSWWQLPPRSVPAEENPNREARTSIDIFNIHKSSGLHPFGKELMQLDEIAEEFGGTVRDAAREADMEVMRTRELKMFCADDYMRDLQPLFDHYFMPQPQVVAWI